MTRLLDMCNGAIIFGVASLISSSLCNSSNPRRAMLISVCILIVIRTILFFI